MEKNRKQWLSVSENFRKDNEEKLAYDLYYDLQKEGNESPLEFAIRNNWELYCTRCFALII